MDLLDVLGKEHLGYSSLVLLISLTLCGPTFDNLQSFVHWHNFNSSYNQLRVDLREGRLRSLLFKFQIRFLKG